MSQRGIVPIAHSQDTAGPLARTVADAALLLSVLAERRARVHRSGRRRGVTRRRRAQLQRRGTRRGRRSGFHASAGLAANAPASCSSIPCRPRSAPAAGQAEFAILLAEFRDDLDVYLAGVESGPRTLDELIAFNTARAAEVMPHFGQELLLAARDGGGTADAAYGAAQQTVAAARTTLAELLAEHDLDALVAPTNGRAWRIDYASGDSFGASSSRIAAATGYPSVTVPVQLANELPLGVSLIGKPGEEPVLLALGAALERERGPFPEPRFLPTIAD